MQPDREKLEDLLRRVEEAAVGSRELDYAIWAVLLPDDNKVPADPSTSADLCSKRTKRLCWSRRSEGSR